MFLQSRASANVLYMFQGAKERPNLILAQIQSRRKNSTKYDVNVHCTCPDGARVVACCAHVASIIYYLSYARYHQKVLRKKTNSYYDIIADAQDYSETSDTDSTDSDDENSSILYSFT